jgi:hypothetical protein
MEDEERTNHRDTEKTTTEKSGVKNEEGRIENGMSRESLS